MTTISKLAYQIVADTSGFTKGVTLTRNELALTKQVMRDSISPTQAYAAEVQALDQVLEKGAISQRQYAEAVGKVKAEYVGELGTKIRNVGAVTAAVAGTVAAAGVLMGKSFLDAYAGAEDAQKKLEGAMRSNGTLSDSAMQSYQRLAAEMQGITKVDDDAALGMLQVAESLDVTGAAADRAVKNAIALQAALGIDAAAAMKMSVSLEQGNVGLLTRYIPALKGIADPAAQAAYAQEALAKMFGVAKAEAQTYAGASAQLGNAVSNLKEEFGAIVAEGMTPLTQSATGVVNSLAGMSDQTKTFVAYTGAGITGLASFVAGVGSAVAVSGQMITAYATIQKTATGAKIAQLGLNTAVGVGYVVAVGAAAVAGYAIGTMLVNQTQWAKDAAKAYAEYAAGVTALQSREAKQRQDTLAAIQAAPQGQRMAMAQAEMATAQKQLDGLTGRAEMARAEMDRMAPSWLSLGQSGKKLWEAQAAEYEELKARAAEAGKWVNTLDDAMRAGGQSAMIDAAAIAAVGQYTAKLQEQVITAGMSADALEQWKLQQQGVTAAQLQAVAAMQQQAAAAAAQAALRSETDQLVDSLQTQIAAIGKSEAEVTRLGLAARGLAPDWLHVIEVMQGELAAAKQTEEVRGKVEQLKLAMREQIATAGMSAEAVERWKLAQAGATLEQIAQVAAIQGQAAAVRDQQAAQKAAADAAKQLQDNVAETTRRLQEQIATAGMSADEIERWKLAQAGASPAALANVAALQEQAAAAKAANAETARSISDQRSLAAATRGSAEAYDRIEAYRKMQAADKTRPKPPAMPQTPPAIATAPITPEMPKTWTPPPAPVLPAVPQEIQVAWGDILGHAPAVPPMATAVTVPAQPTKEPEPPASESPNALLAAAVQLLERIAAASEGEKIVVEQTA